MAQTMAYSDDQDSCRLLMHLQTVNNQNNCELSSFLYRRHICSCLFNYTWRIPFKGGAKTIACLSSQGHGEQTKISKPLLLLLLLLLLDHHLGYTYSCPPPDPCTLVPLPPGMLVHLLLILLPSTAEPGEQEEQNTVLQLRLWWLN